MTRISLPRGRGREVRRGVIGSDDPVGPQELIRTRPGSAGRSAGRSEAAARTFGLSGAWWGW